MDVIEAINARKSIRAFKPDPVPKAILEKVMESAVRAPSWANSQPWDFFIATGDKLEAIKQGFADKAGAESSLDIARPQEFPEPYASRRRPVAARPPEAAPAPVRMDNPEARRLRTRNYGAPCVIYLCTGRSFYFQSKGINAWPIFDLGLSAENIMLAATNYGLGSIALAQAVTYPDVVRKVLGVPESMLVVLGIAIGYPDWNDPVNQRQSVRESLAGVVRWHGFE